MALSHTVGAAIDSVPVLADDPVEKNELVGF
jgi:hypothetical protein